MASLFKRKTAKGVKWWGDYRDAAGIRKRVPLATDKSAAQALLNELVKRADHRRAGLTSDIEEQLRTPLARHLEDFDKDLEARGVTPEYRRATVRRVREIFEDMKARFWPDITPSRVQSALAKLKARTSTKSRNHAFGALRSFVLWAINDRRAPAESPLAGLKALNADADPRRTRRAPAADEVTRLVQAAELGPVIAYLPGADRALLYLAAALSGARKSELASLTPRSFGLDPDSPTMTIEAACSKRRRLDTLPVHPALADRLRDWLASHPRRDDEPLWPGLARKKTEKIIERDLEAARARWLQEADHDPEELERRAETDFLTFSSPSGIFDFHSLRSFYVTELARAGTSLQMAMRLARHSSPHLTAKVYCRLELSDEQAAVAALPAIGTPRENNPGATIPARMTGTDGAGNGVPIRVTTRVPNKCQTPRATLHFRAPVCTDGEKPRHAHDTAEDGNKPRENRDLSGKSVRGMSASDNGMTKAGDGIRTHRTISVTHKQQNKLRKDDDALVPPGVPNESVPEALPPDIQALAERLATLPPEARAALAALLGTTAGDPSPTRGRRGKR